MHCDHARQMSKCCRTAAGLISLIVLALGAHPASAAEIVVSWTTVQQEVRPAQAVRTVQSSVRLTLRGGSAIAETAENVTPRGMRRSATREGQFRDPIGGGTGNRPVTWRVEGPKTLVRTQSFAQHTVTVRVTTISDTSCAATVSFRLKPGFREYRVTRMINGQPMYLSSMSADQISCTVSK